MASRNNTIDVLRALSVLYIVGYWHLFNYTTAFPGYANIYTVGLKDIVLGTFTFTSGYLLANRSVDLGVTEVWSFYRRRLVRIYPLYVIALLLFGWTGLAGQHEVTGGILLVSMFAPPSPPTLWFITMIMVFYLLAPFMIRFADRVGSLLVVSGLMFVALLAFPLTIGSMDLRILMYFPAFVLGVGVARQAPLRELIQRRKWVLALLLVPAFVLFRYGGEGWVWGVLALTPLVLAGTLVAFAYAERYAQGIESVAIYFISYSSFCMYLFHRLIYKYSSTWYFPTDKVYQVAYLLAFSLTATILLSYAVQKGYDRAVVALSRGS